MRMVTLLQVTVGKQLANNLVSLYVSPDLLTNKLLSSAWLDKLDLAWFLQIKLPCSK